MSVDWTLTSEIIRNYAIAASAVVAASTFILSQFDRRRAIRVEKYKEFSNLKRRFESNPEFKKITKILDNGHSQLSNVDIQEKYRFFGFCEEVHLAIENDIIPENVAYHWFGYYALRASENEDFSKVLSLNSNYWGLLRCFLERMNRVEKNWQRANKSSQHLTMKI